jgi:hypothetical protein
MYIYVRTWYINFKYTKDKVCNTGSRGVFINIIIIIIIIGGGKKKAEYTAALVTITKKKCRQNTQILLILSFV